MRRSVLAIGDRNFIEFIPGYDLSGVIRIGDFGEAVKIVVAVREGVTFLIGASRHPAVIVVGQAKLGLAVDIGNLGQITEIVVAIRSNLP